MNLEQFLPAMEAEDITDSVKAPADKIVSGSKSNRPKDDLMKTNDIFGLKDNNKNAGNESDPDEKDDQHDAENEDLSDDNNNNDVNGSPDDNTDDDDTSTEPDDDPDDTDTPEEDSVIPNEVEQKKKLMDNMIMLYNIICNNIKLLADYVTQVPVSSEGSNVLYHITENLTDCKGILYKVISTDFATKDYITLMKSYVGINRVYDLCIEMLNKHFDNLELQARPTHIKHRKKGINTKSKPNSSAKK